MECPMSQGSLPSCQPNVFAAGSVVKGRKTRLAGGLSRGFEGLSWLGHPYGLQIRSQVA